MILNICLYTYVYVTVSMDVYTHICFPTLPLRDARGNDTPGAVSTSVYRCGCTLHGKDPDLKAILPALTESQAQRTSRSVLSL